MSHLIFINDVLMFVEAKIENIVKVNKLVADWHYYQVDYE